MVTTMWSSGRSSVCPGEMPLSEYERRCIARATGRAKDVILMDIRHMAERCVTVDGALPNVHFWLFCLPDFTRLFKDWYQRYLEATLRLYQPNAHAMLSDDGTWLLLRYEGDRPRTVIERAIRRGQYDDVLSLIARAERAERMAEDALRMHETSQPCTAVDLDPLITAVTAYVAFGLESLFPEEIIVERFPTVALNRLYWTPVSAWQRLLDAAMRSLERVYIGEAREDEAMERYAREVSFLRWGDIASHEEDLTFTKRLFVGLRSEFLHYPAIWEAEEQRQFHVRVYGSPLTQYERYVAEERTRIAKDDHALFDVLVRFAREAQRYNEMRRILFTRALRILRAQAIAQGLDWRTAALADLLSTTTRERRSSHGVLHLQGSVT
ncbi:hypothetical protein HY635_04235 [Candidatus Uhrbacteria bacterium]|nr:hypothetical protein [Candidatus Uhrbacteria bacterium]